MTRASHDRPLPLRISELVRGPAALREDIADEIADHLACHAEEQGSYDPTAAEADAIRAFGNPEQIARELRTVHLGDWIMFQKVMVVALVLIVAGMAISMYFSYSATREMSRQMADVTRETSKQFGEVAKQLASLNNAQSVSQPPRLRIFCYTVAPEEPAVKYSLSVESIDVGDGANRRGRSFGDKYETDAVGWIDTGPLPLGLYHLSGETVSPGAEPNAVHGRWTRVVRLQQSGRTREERICVGSRLKHEVRLVLPPDVTWDLEAMKAMAVSVRFNRTVGPHIFGSDSETWLTSPCSVALSAGATLVGLVPGTAMLGLDLPQGWRNQQGLSYGRVILMTPIEIHKDGQPIQLQFKHVSDHRITGLVYNVSKDKPVVGAKIEIIHYGDDFRRPYGDENLPRPSEGGRAKVGEPLSEFLRTDVAGRFGSLASAYRSELVLHWKAPDGAPSTFVKGFDVQPGLNNASLTSPLYWEIDVSKLSTVRITCTGLNRLRAKGFELSEDQTSQIEWRIGGDAPGSEEDHLSFLCGGGSISCERKGDTLVATGLIPSGRYLLGPSVRLRGHKSVRSTRSLGLDLNRTFVKQDLEPGQVHEIRFALEEALVEPRVLAPARVIRPTTTGATTTPAQPTPK